MKFLCPLDRGCSFWTCEWNLALRCNYDDYVQRLCKINDDVSHSLLLRKKVVLTRISLIKGYVSVPIVGGAGKVVDPISIVSVIIVAINISSLSTSFRPLRGVCVAGARGVLYHVDSALY